MGSVLVVDDERSIRITVKAFLEDDGHLVETAEDTQSAVAILQKAPIDVVLTDIILPRSSGVDLLKKAGKISPDVLVIMMTGEPTLETAAESLRFGAIDYLQKPIGKNEILKSVRNALRIKHLHDEKKRLEEENRRYTDHLEHLVAERTRALAGSEAALRHRAEELAVLNRLAREVGAGMTADATIQSGLREISQASRSDLSAAFLRREDSLVRRGLFPEWAENTWQLTDIRPWVERLCELAVRERRPVYSGDIRTDARRPSGEHRTAGFSSAVALPLKSGAEILGVIGLASINAGNFSHQGSFLEALAGEMAIGLKKNLLYEQLQQHAEDLQASIVRIRKAEAEHLNLQAQLQQAQKMEAMGVLAGGIAHDFNNILAAVIGYTQLAMGSAPQESNIRRYLTRVMDAGLRARELVQQILTFSRQSKREVSPVHLSPIIKEALQLLRASLPATIEISQHIDSELTAMADPTQMHQVLVNLCTNAAHAMRKKGGVLHVSLTDVLLDSQFTEDHPEISPGSYLCLAVKDTGQGMSQCILDRMFDPFFTTKKKGEGTGLGLSVVHGIIKSLNGHILVRSRPGKGTSFEIFLPAISTEELKPVSADEPIPAGDERILLVDDETMLVEANKDLLESLGYTVTGVTGAPEALDIFRLQPQYFDLVITDSIMPHMTGGSLAKALLEIRSDLPIIMCSGFSDSINAEAMGKIGVRALLHKPVLKRDLAETIRQVLDTAPQTANG